MLVERKGLMVKKNVSVHDKRGIKDLRGFLEKPKVGLIKKER